MRKQLRVALLGDTSSDYSRGVLSGIQSYISKHDQWETYLSERLPDDPPEWLNTWQGDGIIARIDNQRMHDALQKMRIPVVAVSATLAARDFPYVHTDDEAISALAASHLLERQFQHFAYCGNDRFAWSQMRGTCFSKAIRAAGFECHTFILNKNKTPQFDPSMWEDEQEISEWLKKLPKPIGIMACEDVRGWQLLEICRRSKIVVPEEVAIIGVDNNARLCGLSTPTLSSIEPDTFTTGYEAARLLDRWMMTKQQPSPAVFVKPVGVVARKSTDVIAIADPDVARAMQMIREHACDGINVEDILKVIPVSRRHLESRFKSILGSTPHDHIINTRFRRVMKLLTETNLSVTEISIRTGFCYPEYLCTAFKRRFGIRPDEYRKKSSKPPESVLQQ